MAFRKWLHSNPGFFFYFFFNFQQQKSLQEQGSSEITDMQQNLCVELLAFLCTPQEYYP